MYARRDRAGESTLVRSYPNTIWRTLVHARSLYRLAAISSLPAAGRNGDLFSPHQADRRPHNIRVCYLVYYLLLNTSHLLRFPFLVSRLRLVDLQLDAHYADNRRTTETESGPNYTRKIVDLPIHNENSWTNRFNRLCLPTNLLSRRTLSSTAIFSRKSEQRTLTHKLFGKIRVKVSTNLWNYCIQRHKIGRRCPAVTWQSSLDSLGPIRQ